MRERGRRVLLFRAEKEVLSYKLLGQKPEEIKEEAMRLI